MTYNQLLLEAGKFNDKTKYRLIPKNGNIARIRLIKLLLMAMDKKSKQAFSPDLKLFKEVATQNPESKIAKNFDTSISCTFEGVVTRALATTATFFSYRSYDISEQGNAFEKIKGEPIIEFFENFKSHTGDFSEERIAELLNKSVDSRFKKHDGILPIMMFIGELILMHRIDIDEHLNLYFSYSEK